LRLRADQPDDRADDHDHGRAAPWHCDGDAAQLDDHDDAYAIADAIASPNCVASCGIAARRDIAVSRALDGQGDFALGCG
jgi:hypothetical protein